MNTTIKKFAKEFLEKYACLDTHMSIPLMTWKPDLTITQRRAVVREAKRLLAGSVIFLPSGFPGVAYSTPISIFWRGTSLCIKSDVVYICKHDGKTTMLKTCDTNYIIPEYSVRTIPYNNFAKIFEEMKPRLKF